MHAEISKEKKMHKNTFGYTVCIQISCTFHLRGDQEMHPTRTRNNSRGGVVGGKGRWTEMHWAQRIFRVRCKMMRIE